MQQIEDTPALEPSPALAGMSAWGRVLPALGHETTRGPDTRDNEGKRGTVTWTLVWRMWIPGYVRGPFTCHTVSDLTFWNEWLLTSDTTG